MGNKIRTDPVDVHGDPRSMPDQISQHHTAIDGAEVIARELATSPHPRWKDQHPQTHHFITKLLLADGREIYECNHCHVTDAELKSVTAHQGRHRIAPKKPITDEDTIRTLLREAERARRMYGPSRYAQPTAEALTRLGLTPAQGGEWTSAAVSNLYNTWKDRYPVRAPKVVTRPRPTTAARKPADKTPPVGVQPTPAVASPPASSSDKDLMQVLVQVDAAIHHAMRLVTAATEPDEQTVEKAAMLDRLVAGLGEDTINKLLA
jgi:hypothetical protein